MLMFELGFGLDSKGGSACRFWFKFGLGGVSDEIGEFAGVGGMLPLLIDKERMAAWSDACAKS